MFPRCACVYLMRLSTLKCLDSNLIILYRAKVLVPGTGTGRERVAAESSRLYVTIPFSFRGRVYTLEPEHFVLHHLVTPDPG